jgi:hypothetical protein
MMRVVAFVISNLAALFFALIAGAGANMALGWRLDSFNTAAFMIVVYTLVSVSAFWLQRRDA